DVAQTLFAGAQRGFGGPAIGDVAVIHEDGADCRVVEAVDRDRFDVPPRSVLVPDSELARDRNAWTAHAFHEYVTGVRKIVGMYQLEGAPVPAFLERAAEETSGRFTLKADLPLRAQHDDRVLAVLDENLE